MFKVIDKLLVRNVCCVSVQGDTVLLKNGLKLIDEKGNVFSIKSIAMTHYKTIEDYCNCAELELSGDVKNIGKYLYLHD